jgi:hypothetical protein
VKIGWATPVRRSTMSARRGDSFVNTRARLVSMSWITPGYEATSDNRGLGSTQTSRHSTEA